MPVKQRDLDKIQEVEFIKSTRNNKDHQQGVVNLMDKANKVPLVPRPDENFKLNENMPGSP